MKLVSSVVALLLIVGSVGLAWWPLMSTETALTAELGGYETVGGGSWAMRLGYTAAFTAAIVALALRPIRWVRGRLAGTRYAEIVPVVLMHWALYTPVWGWTAAGVANARFGPTEGVAVEVQFVGVDKRSKGPDHWNFARPDGESWSLSEIRPSGLEPGKRLILFERRGALGMTYVAQR